MPKRMTHEEYKQDVMNKVKSVHTNIYPLEECTDVFKKIKWKFKGYDDVITYSYYVLSRRKTLLECATYITESINKEQRQKEEKEKQRLSEELASIIALNLSINIVLAKKQKESRAHAVYVCTCLFCGDTRNWTATTYTKRPYCSACLKKEQKEAQRYEAECVFIAKAEDIYGELYDYSLVDYKNNHIRVDILCKKCNKIFPKSPNNHSSKEQGCPDCTLERLSEIYISERAQTFFIDATLYWDGQFDYSESVYKGAHTPIIVKCIICGDSQPVTPSNHIHKTNPTGCTGCNGSKGENRIKEILRLKEINYVLQKTFPDCKDVRLLRFDFYLPDYNLLVEYHGGQHYKFVKFFHHTLACFKDGQKKDKIKKEYAEKHCNFLTIPYWEFANMSGIIKQKIKTIINKEIKQ